MTLYCPRCNAEITPVGGNVLPDRQWSESENKTGMFLGAAFCVVLILTLAFLLRENMRTKVEIERVKHQADLDHPPIWRK